jgi:phage tail sheath protein FI
MRAQAALEYRRDLGRALLNADARTASYAALYYPWLIERAADGELRRCGPEGALCGMIAAQSLARGAWIAPANQPLRRALAPTQRIEQADAIELYSAAVNSIAASVRGCVALSAQTLSDEPELTQLNVRRLLILLRRIALRDSQEHVFAPHSPAFRRRVKLSLERLLAALYARGAFAGNDPAAAYRVRIDETINTPTSIEAGRFVVELQVAPAQPLAFITVRLFETATGTLLVQEV